MPTVIALQIALLEALSSGRNVSKPAGDKPGERAVTLHLRGEEGKPAWITGVDIKSDFTGTEEEVASFMEEMGTVLERVNQQVDFQKKMKAQFGF